MRAIKVCGQPKLLTVNGEMHIAKCLLGKRHDGLDHYDRQLNVSWKDERVGQR